MNPWLLLKAEWRRSWGGVTVLSLVLALSVCLGLTVSMIERGLRQGVTQAAEAFDLLVGTPGSASQLLLSTVYLQAQPLPLLEHEVFTRLAALPDVDWAAPMAFGDRWNECPLVGTTPVLATLGGRRPLAEGRVFGDHDEAVVGALVPLGLDETFAPSHGLIEVPDGAKNHEEVHFKVVGRLPHTGTPWDRAILVPLEAVWDAHHLEAGEHGAGISAVAVRPVSMAAAYRLRSAWQTPSTQAVFTGEVLTELFATLGDVRLIMQIMAGASQLIALAGVVLASCFAVALRRETLGLLRTLGAPRAYLMLSVWCMVGVIVTLGVAMGTIFSLMATWTMAKAAQAITATTLPVALAATEWRTLALFVLAGLCAGCVPALAVYRKERQTEGPAAAVEINGGRNA